MSSQSGTLIIIYLALLSLGCGVFLSHPRPTRRPPNPPRPLLVPLQWSESLRSKSVAGANVGAIFLRISLCYRKLINKINRHINYY